MVLLDLDFDVEVRDRSELGRAASKPGGCCCLACCCCCSGCRTQAPADGFLADGE